MEDISEYAIDYPVVYCLVENGNVVYIGSSKNLRGRVMGHHINLANVTHIGIIPSNLKDYVILEQKIIQEVSPPLNNTVNIRLAKEWKKSLPKFKMFSKEDLLKVKVKKTSSPLIYTEPDKLFIYYKGLTLFMEGDNCGIKPYKSTKIFFSGLVYPISDFSCNEDIITTLKREIDKLSKGS